MRAAVSTLGTNSVIPFVRFFRNYDRSTTSISFCVRRCRLRPLSGSRVIVCIQRAVCYSTFLANCFARTRCRSARMRAAVSALGANAVTPLVNFFLYYRSVTASIRLCVRRCRLCPLSGVCVVACVQDAVFNSAARTNCFAFACSDSARMRTNRFIIWRRIVRRFTFCRGIKRRLALRRYFFRRFFARLICGILNRRLGRFLSRILCIVLRIARKQRKCLHNKHQNCQCDCNYTLFVYHFVFLLVLVLFIYQFFIYRILYSRAYFALPLERYPYKRLLRYPCCSPASL